MSSLTAIIYCKGGGGGGTYLGILESLMNMALCSVTLSPMGLRMWEEGGGGGYLLGHSGVLDEHGFMQCYVEPHGFEDEGGGGGGTYLGILESLMNMALCSVTLSPMGLRICISVLLWRRASRQSSPEIMQHNYHKLLLIDI